MTNQPPAPPPHQPSEQPTGQPVEGDPATQRMPAAASSSPAAPPPEPPKKVWQEATSTRGGRWAIAVAAGAVAVLMLVGVGALGLLALRHHDRFALMGERRDAQSHEQRGFGDGRGPGANRDDSPKQRMPGLRGDRAQRPGGLGGVLGGGALHGSVTATVDGSVQALVFQRGEVTAVSGTSITLKSSDGFVGTYGRSSSTKVKGADPTKGGQALVVAQASDKVALRIVAMPSAAGAAPSS